MENSTPYQVELCSNKCCPTLTKEGDLWIIKDDHDGKVQLTSEELAKLIKEFYRDNIPPTPGRKDWTPMI